MDFRAAHARAQAERELRWRENWEGLSLGARRALKLRSLLGLLVAAAVVALQHMGLPWILPLYIGIALVFVTFRQIRRRRGA